MKQKTRFKNFRNIAYRLSVHEWPIYRHRLQKSHIGRSVVVGNPTAPKTSDSLVLTTPQPWLWH